MAFVIDRYGSFKMTHRDNTSDIGVVSAVLRDNSYGFPTNLDGKTMIDIGGHIGSAAIRCAASGAKVFSFEPEEVNYRLLVENSKEYADITCYNCAVGTPGNRKIYLDPNNTGANCMFNEYGGKFQEIETVSFETALKMAGGRCDLLKLDCEGAEVEILPDVINSGIPLVYAEIHWGMGLDQELKSLVDQMDRVYTRHNMSNCEFRWTR